MPNKQKKPTQLFIAEYWPNYPQNNLTQRSTPICHVESE